MNQFKPEFLDTSRPYDRPDVDAIHGMRMDAPLYIPAGCTEKGPVFYPALSQLVHRETYEKL